MSQRCGPRPRWLSRVLWRDPAPGTPIPASDAYQRLPDPARFAVLTLTIDQIDAVHLSGDYHRRGLFSRNDGWQGGWLAP